MRPATDSSSYWTSTQVFRAAVEVFVDRAGECAIQ